MSNLHYSIAKAIKMPKLTALEAFVWAHQGEHSHFIAAMTNRDPATISRAFSRAANKLQRIEDINRVLAQAKKIEKAVDPSA